MDDLAEVDYGDFEPLPALSEEEENVSLADVLSLQDCCLTEQDIWAICLECIQSLKSIVHSAIFQTLCITPDTLAFNTNGNVSFMEQISDDPEGAFVPPEIDETGNTLEAHLYSLGATLKAALEYMMESEMDAEYNHDLYILLEEMQMENPKERPGVEDVISLCKEKLKLSSSSDICQGLSAAGRRMLSIDSYGPFQDSSDTMWKSKLSEMVSQYEKYTDDTLTENILPAAEDVKTACSNSSPGMNSNNIKTMKIKLKEERVCCQSISTWITKSKERNHGVKCNTKLNARLCKVERDTFEGNGLRKVETFPKLPFNSETESRTFLYFTGHNMSLAKKQHPSSLINNKYTLHTTLHGNSSQFNKYNQPGSKTASLQGPNNTSKKISLSPNVSPMYLLHMATCDKIAAADFLSCSYTYPETSDTHGRSDELDEENFGPNRLEDRNIGELPDEASQKSNQNRLLCINKISGAITALRETGCCTNLLHSLEKNHAERKDCWIDDRQQEDWDSEMTNNEQCIFLKHILIHYGKPLKDYELWALCHECLLTLETYTDYPAYLCFDSVALNPDGSIIFIPPGDEGSYDTFYLAPERAEVDFVTEKVCIYCMAEILWRAARCNFPSDHKLVLPGKLKNFLLNMARSRSEDRPSLADAVQICHNYLHEQNINSKEVLEVLSKASFQGFREEESFNVNLPFDLQNERSSVNDNLGFLPRSNESKLIAVKGPIPCKTYLSKESIVLPNAFTSSATHFKPIILHQNIDNKIDAVAATVAESETMPGSPMNSSTVPGNPKDEDSNLQTACMISAVVRHSEEGLETLHQNNPTYLSPSNTGSSSPNLPLLSESSCLPQEGHNWQTSSSVRSNCILPSNMAFTNNFLLKQDPETRVLTLVPVQIAISEQIPNKPLHSETAYNGFPSWHVLLSDSVTKCDANGTLQTNSSTNDLKNDKVSGVQDKCWDTKAKSDSLAPTTINKETQTKCSESNPSLETDSENNFLLSDHALDVSVDRNSDCSLIQESPLQCKGIHDVSLERVVQLIQEESGVDRFQENTTDALAVGKYIFSLKDLRYNTFRSAISEKFCDLHWEEKLLENLYDAANGRTPVSISTNEAKIWSKTFQARHSNSLLNGSDEAQAVNIADLEASDLPPDKPQKEVESLTLMFGTQREDVCLQTNKCCREASLTEKSSKQEEMQVKMEDNNYTSSSCPSEWPRCCPGWSSAFYGSECFSLDVHNYFRKLGKQKAHGTQNIDAKKIELDQLIMIETKNYRKSLVFHQRLLRKERSSKGGEMKAMLPKLERQVEEMRSKVQFLELVKKYLQIMHAEKWGVEPCNFLTVVNMGRNEALDISALDTMLIFNNVNKSQYEAQCNENRYCLRNLQAGTPLGLMTYLYSRNAFLEGYVQQFLFTFRYFCSQEELLQFLLDRIRITISSSSLESCSLISKIYHRSFSILQTWIEDFRAVDFTINPNFMSMLKDFIISKVVPLNGHSKWFLSLLNNIASRQGESVYQCNKMDEWEEGKEIKEAHSLHSSILKISTNVFPKSLSWKLLKGNEPVAYKSGSCTKIAEAPYFLTEYTAEQLFCQLTLLEQEIFHRCHPVHFLNSRLLGVRDKIVPCSKAASSELLSTPSYNLFVKNCFQDDYLLKLLKYADSVSTWVAAEIVTCSSSKVQMNLVSKFLSIAKCCYKERNFATAMQILKGLENLIVRQLSIWKNLPSKVSDILEELKAVEVFLKSDSLCLMEGERFKTSPTIPSAHILAMHVQQLETGGFTMRNGTYKWTKLRNISKVVSQVQAFQENPYMFPPDHQLQTFLRQKISSLNDADIFALAADNFANFHHKAEKQSRKIQDALHKMKAMFQ